MKTPKNTAVTLDQIMRAIEQAGKPVSATQIATLTHSTHANVSVQLAKMPVEMRKKLRDVVNPRHDNDRCRRYRLATPEEIEIAETQTAQSRTFRRPDSKVYQMPQCMLERLEEARQERAMYPSRQN